MFEVCKCDFYNWLRYRLTVIRKKSKTQYCDKVVRKPICLYIYFHIWLTITIMYKVHKTNKIINTVVANLFPTNRKLSNIIPFRNNPPTFKQGKGFSEEGVLEIEAIYYHSHLQYHRHPVSKIVIGHGCSWTFEQLTSSQRVFRLETVS